MKKYILPLLLALVLVASLCACDLNATPPADTTDSTASDSTADNSTEGDTHGGLTIDTAGATDGDDSSADPAESGDPSTGTSDTPATGETDANGTPSTGDSTDTPSTGDTTPVVETITLEFNGTAVSAYNAAGQKINATNYLTTASNPTAFVINKPGSYELKGDLSGAQLRVEIDKLADIELILNNFTASSNTSAPLYIMSANKATIVLAAGSINTLTDAKLYQYAVAGETKPNACLYSEDDLTIKGDGTLNVNGNYNNGIGCKNDLRIKSGTLNVTAPNNILKGNDSVEVEAATLKLSGGEDAIKADEELKEGKGFILIMAGAKIDINCSDDALQAAKSVTVEAGATITGTAGGDAVNCAGVITTDPAAMQITSATQPAA